MGKACACMLRIIQPYARWLCRCYNPMTSNRPDPVSLIAVRHVQLGRLSRTRADPSCHPLRRDTDDFVQDIRGRVLGSPEISTDGWHPFRVSIRDAFRNSAHGVIVKTLSVTDLRKDVAHRYSPCSVVAVAREAVMGVPAEISTSYVERSNLSIRMASRRFSLGAVRLLR
jgi:hypothetical protein